jgi:glycosyltransferase involved in cell wall biosynthesis
MRIQFLSSSGQLGGAEVCLLDMLASLRQAYPDWDLGLVVPQRGLVSEKAKQLGVTTEVLPFPAALSRLGDSRPAGGSWGRLLLGAKLTTSLCSVVGYSRRLGQTISSFAPDLLHSNGLKMSVLGARAKDPGLPMVWHIHDYVSSRPFMRKVLRLYGRSPIATLANSHSVREDLCACLKNGTGVYTFYNAVDLATFAPEGPKADLDRLCGIPAPAAPVLRVGLIATMAWWKGHKDFIQSLALLGEEENIRGYIIGGPVYQSEGSEVHLAELRALSSELKLQARLGFTGFVEKPASAIRALDVVVHASIRPEPFGRAIIEAMACAKPVITTAIGGAAELIEPDENALVFRPGDPVQLAAQIRQLAQNSELRKQLAVAGRKTVLKNFDRRLLGSRLMAFYQRVMKRPDTFAPDISVPAAH